MKRISALLLLAAQLTAAHAQTNTTRVMSLADCFAEALQHNLDVQVERYTPQLALYDLYSAYAGYDPAFSLSAGHSYDKSGGLFITNSVPFSRVNTVGSDLGGSLPWGMTYDLSGSFSDTTTSDSSGGSAGVTVAQPSWHFAREE